MGVAAAALSVPLAGAALVSAAALATIALAWSGVMVTKAVLKDWTAAVVADAALESTGVGEAALESTGALAAVADAALESTDTGLETGAVEFEEDADAAEPEEPVRDNEAKPSGIVSMKAIVGPATRVLVA